MRRVRLVVEASREDGSVLADARVSIRHGGDGRVVAEEGTDERGIAEVFLPPGSFEIFVGEAKVRTFLDVDTLVRVVAENRLPPPPAPSRYQLQARQALGYVQDFEPGRLRDDGWN